MSGPRTVAIAAPNQAAAEAGSQIAAVGGNAIDAAIAASFVTMVNEVGIVSLSSGGFITIQPAGDTVAHTVDGWMDMPGRGTSSRRSGTWDITTEYGGGVDITIGPGSVATHGSIAAFGLAHERWGSLPWAELVQPAIEEARRGFELSGASRYYLDYVYDKVFGWDLASRRILHDHDGAVTTSPIVVPDLAHTLEFIAEHGSRAMHEGDLAELIADDVSDRGGLLSPLDVASYQPIVRSSLTAGMGDWILGTNPPPAVGGVCVAAMLTLMGDHGVSDREHLIEVQRRVLGERLRVLDHTDDLERDAAAFLDLIDRDQLAVLESGSTAHVSTTDSDGNACALTVSSGYSSGMIARGTGVWLNNCLGEQELNPRGLHGLEPGTRLLSNMAPTVGRHRDGSVMAIGSPGADRITTAILQVLAGFANDSLGIQEAVDQSRVHVHRAGRPDEDIKVETDLSMYFGGVGAALSRPDGSMEAAADPRRDGAVRIQASGR